MPNINQWKMVKMRKSYKGVYRTPTTFKKELFIKLVQDRQPLANVPKESILNVVRVLDLSSSEINITVWEMYLVSFFLITKHIGNGVLVSCKMYNFYQKLFKKIILEHLKGTARKL